MCKDPQVFIANALAPAKNLHVIITDPKKQEAIVVVDDDDNTKIMLIFRKLKK